MTAKRASAPTVASVPHVDQRGDLEVTTIGIDTTHALVQLRGELDVASEPLVTAVLENQLGLGRRFVLLDLSRLSFCDCAGLHAIVAGHHAFVAAGGALRLAGLTRRLSRLLKLAHLDEVLILNDRPVVTRTKSDRHLGAVRRR